MFGKQSIVPSAPRRRPATPKTEDGPQKTRSRSLHREVGGVVVVPVAGALLDRDDVVEVGEARDERGRERVHRIAGDVVEQHRQADCGVTSRVMREDLVVGQLYEIGRQDQRAVARRLPRRACVSATVSSTVTAPVPTITVPRPADGLARDVDRGACARHGVIAQNSPVQPPATKPVAPAASRRSILSENERSSMRPSSSKGVVTAGIGPDQFTLFLSMLRVILEVI